MSLFPMVDKVLMNPFVSEKIYSNQGNPQLVDLIQIDCGNFLDIGCGAGDNAILIRNKNAECLVFGVTGSSAEAEIAKWKMESCWTFDIEGEIPAELLKLSFDVLVFSHVLEHVRDPAAVLLRFTSLLRQGGQVLIAVPNVLSWRMRIQFLLGKFEYESAGVLDDTHLRFFTYFTADKYLLTKLPNLKIVSKTVSGGVPLWWLRRHILPGKCAKRIDEWGCQKWPNLFGSQILISAIKI